MLWLYLRQKQNTRRPHKLARKLFGFKGYWRSSGTSKRRSFCFVTVRVLLIARNTTFHSRTKHIGLQYHFVREVVEDGNVDMQKIYADENVTNITKLINTDKFVWCRFSYGVVEIQASVELASAKEAARITKR